MKMPKTCHFCNYIDGDFQFKRPCGRFIMTINYRLIIKTFWIEIDRGKFLSCLIAALTVRYLTRRFIGEYRSNTDLLYKQTVTLESGLLDVEIIDVSVDDEDGFPIDQIQWADAVLIVYSITDRESFDYAQRSLGEIRQIQNGPVTYLVANKADLDHLRLVRMKLSHYFSAAIGMELPRSCLRNVSARKKVCQQLFIFHLDFPSTQQQSLHPLNWLAVWAFDEWKFSIREMLMRMHER